MALGRIGQQGIVFAIFAALFAVFAFTLHGFATPDNMLTLLQNVAVLGILGLAMAIVVIGRGIDISLIAATFCSNVSIFSGVAKPCKVIAKTANSAAKIANTIPCCPIRPSAIPIDFPLVP